MRLGRKGFEVTKPEIKIGDSFIKTENPGTVWVVRKFVDYPELPRHVELKPEGDINRKITLSVSALMDRNLLQRVEKH